MMKRNGQWPTTVLLVDPDPVAATARSAALASLRPQWAISTVADSTAAIDTIASVPHLNAIVTTLDLGNTDASSVLAAAALRFPSSARIVVSPPTVRRGAINPMPTAHRFLAEPATAGELAHGIERSLELQQRLADPSVLTLIESLELLPSPPATILRLNHLLLDADVALDDVANVITSDPALTLKLLQLVNSAYFGLSQRVTSARQAVAFLGVVTVRNLLIAVELIRALQVPRGDLNAAVQEVHQHSLAVAELARSLMSDRPDHQDAFTAGILHDIGMLAVIAGAPDRFVALREEVVNGGAVKECEQHILGTSHANIGAYLLDHWGVPTSMVEAVARSHDAATLPEPTMAPVHAVYVAEQVLTISSSPPSFWEESDLLDGTYLNALGIHDEVAALLSGARVG